jgi:hypothetical protein
MIRNSLTPSLWRFRPAGLTNHRKFSRDAPIYMIFTGIDILMSIQQDSPILAWMGFPHCSISRILVAEQPPNHVWWSTELYILNQLFKT